MENNNDTSCPLCGSVNIVPDIGQSLNCNDCNFSFIPDSDSNTFVIDLRDFDVRLRVNKTNKNLELQAIMKDNENESSILLPRLKTHFDTNVSAYEWLNFNVVRERIDDSNNYGIGIILQTHGDLEGKIILFIDKQSSLKLLDLFKGKDFGTTKIISDLNKSAVKEISDLLITSCLDSISRNFNLNVTKLKPEIAFDLPGPIIDHIVSGLDQIPSEVITLETTFVEKLEQIRLFLVILPNTESTEVLQRKFNLSFNDDYNLNF